MSFKIELRTNVDCFIAAYHRNRWVAVPLFYIPLEAIGEDGHLHSYRFIPEDGQEFSTSLPRRSIPAEENIHHQIQETILPWTLPKKELEELCTKNDISEYWISGNQRKISKKSSGDRSSRRKKRKYAVLKKTEYKKFISKLRKISKQSTVIADILWFLNERLKLGDGYVTLAEILRMRVRDVDPEDGITTCIRLKRTGLQGRHELLHYLPEFIWKPLCLLIKQDSVFVFSNKNRGPLLSIDVTKHFKKAGALAGIKGTISSLSLRPIGKQCPSQGDASKGIKMTYDVTRLQEISVKEWKKLVTQIPGLIGKRGRSSEHNPRIIFNAILFHLRTSTPYRKLPSIYPPAKAVHSQYRRWKEKGVLDAVLKARK